MRPYDLEVAKNGHSESCAEHGGGDCTCSQAERCEQCGALNTFAHGHADGCTVEADWLKAQGGAQ